MANKVLSVVVPTYNMEAYLPRCLDSVTRENVPDTLEVIVVNDGSKDRSLEIAKEYQAKRPDIIQIIDKPNGHYGSCINAALKIATGKYFRPLDADDWFDTDALITFLHYTEASDADLVITNYKCHRKTKTINYQSKKTKYGHIYKDSDFNVLKMQTDMLFEMHAFTYKTNLLHQVKLHLTEGVSYTDTEYVFAPLRLLNSFAFANITLYNYNVAREGQSISANVLKKNCNQQGNLLKGLLYSKENYTPIEELVLCHFFKNYIYRLLFCFSNDKILAEFNTILKEKSPHLRGLIDKALLHTLSIWQLTGLHFYGYEWFKRTFRIDR